MYIHKQFEQLCQLPSDSPLTRRMCVSLEVRIQQFQGLRREGRASFSLLRWLHANKVSQMVLAGLVAVPVATETHSNQNRRIHE